MHEERSDDIQPAEEEVAPEAMIESGAQLSSGEQIDALGAEREESNTESNESKEQLQRVQAEFINYRRRAEEEREEQQKYANSRLILKLLPVLDEFSMAVDHAARSDAEAAWVEGIKLIHRKLYSLVESEKVTRIEAQGKEFDPLEHEAVGYQESADHQEGWILSVVRDGYKLHSRVIRPAMVILAKRPDRLENENHPLMGKETEDA